MRLKVSDLSPHQRVLLREADPVPAVEEPQTGDSGGDRPAAGVRGRPGGKASRGSRFRLTAPEPAERVVLTAVLKRLRLHPKVAWVERLNVAQGRLAREDGSAGQWMRFGWRGAPDLLGMLVGGTLLAVEVKRPSGRLRPDQEAFLNTVRCQGGCAFVARSIDDVEAYLG